MPDLTNTVWMFHAATSQEGVKGVLKLEPRGIVFTAPGQGERAFPFDQIRKVRRVRGSPVLELRLRPAGGPRLVGFYFVQPPSLQAQDDSGMFKKRRLRRDAAASLMKLNAVKKGEIQTWVESIEQELRGGA
jgi:hypothetical protein